MRIRYLKPDFFKDEDLVELPYWTRLLYAGIWTMADREGRLEDRSKRIKVELFPYDKVDIEKGLMQLASNKKHNSRPFIARYEVDGERYIQILNWHKHQKPHNTERDSVIPPLTTPLKKDKENGDGEGHEGMTKLSNGVLTVKDKEKTEPNRKQWFIDVWSRYPSKIGRKEAERHFLASVRNEVHLHQINTALENYLKSERVEKGYIQNGKTWFNNWTDWIDFIEKKSEKNEYSELQKKFGLRKE